MRLRPEHKSQLSGQHIKSGTNLFRVVEAAVLASFQHTELHSRRKTTGRELAGVPQRESHLRVELGPPELWKLVGEAQYTGEIPVSEGGGRRLPKRTVWNIGLAVNLSGIPGNFFARRLQGFWLSLDFQNVGDVAVRDTLAFPQPGRNASLGFEAQW